MAEKKPNKQNEYCPETDLEERLCFFKRSVMRQAVVFSQEIEGN